MSARRARAALGAVLAVTLAGCAAGPDPATSSAPPATPSPSPSSSETASPSDDAASPPPSADLIDCDSVLDPHEYDQLAESGLVFQPDGGAIGDVAVDLLADGALSCTWAAPESDVVLWVVRLPEPDSEWGSRRAELLAEGWVETDDPVPETYRAPPDYIAIADPTMLRAGGVTFYLSSHESATSLAEVD